ncbi:unnamed protein product [Calypogeia fissa]
MVPSEVEFKRWYKALFEEDCVEVKGLLKEHGKLLKVGWKSDPSREVEGSLDNHWKPKIKRKWTGRTALHVGARRGDVELVQQVLTLCDINDVGLLARRTAAELASKKRFSKETEANKSREETRGGANDDWGVEFHQGIECDGCGMEPILGPRFRSHSIHYSLCLNCFEGRGADEKECYARIGSETYRMRLAGRTRGKFDQHTNLTSDFTQKNSSTPDDAVDTRDRLGESYSAISTPKVLHES